MKLIDEQENVELHIGDTITDDNGVIWFVLGWSSHGWVQLIENDVLAEHAKKFNPFGFDLRIEV